MGILEQLAGLFSSAPRNSAMMSPGMGGSNLGIMGQMQSGLTSGKFSPALMQMGQSLQQQQPQPMQMAPMQMRPMQPVQFSPYAYGGFRGYS